MNTTVRSTILAAMEKMLRPLVRVLLKYQVSYGEFTKLVRRTYVDVAHTDFTIPNRKSTYSKVAVMTGIDRKMVQEILNQKKDNPEENDVPVNKGLSIVKTWTTTNAYLTEDGKSRDLPLRGPLSFESLVKQTCADFSARALLDELIRVGVVTKIDKETVRLVNDVYIPTQNEIELIKILITCTRDLLVTGEHNLNHSGEQAWFQREVPYSNIPESVVEEFKEYSNKKSQALISDVNRWLKQRKISVGKQNTGDTRRVGLGIYYIETDNKGD